jgi:hypothetical protein
MATITVTNTNNSGAGSLRDAIARAQAGDTIAFASTLTNRTITLTSGEILLNKNLTIDGSAAPNLTISGNNASRVFFVERNMSATLRNLTIANGTTTDPKGGGGVGTGNFTTLNVVNCQFVNNRAVVGGALRTGYGAKTTVTNSLFDNNDGTLNGGTGFSAGAIATFGAGGAGGPGSLTVTGSRFTNNRGFNGGAIYSLLGPLTVENSVFLNNRAIGNGGGAIFTDGANPVGPKATVGGTIAVRGSWFEGNQAKGEGGALFLYGYAPDKIFLENSTVIGNSVTRSDKNLARGGGLRANSELTVRNVTFANNTADGQGGGLWIDGKQPINILNSTFSGNRVVNDAGGAMFLNTALTAPVNIQNSTIVNNSAGRANGALWMNNVSQPVTLTNSIVAFNTAGDRLQQQVGFQPRDGGGNIEFPAPAFGARRVAAGSQIADPLTGSLQNIGGVLVHPLLSGSPAINAGVAGALTTDQRGAARVGRADIGAFEFGATSPLATNFSIGDINVAEGNNGTSAAIFTVRRSGSSSRLATVDYRTANGTAIAGTDYRSTSGSLVFFPGQTTAQIRVDITGDLNTEANETFFVNLSAVRNAAISDAQAIATIQNDDGAAASLMTSDSQMLQASSLSRQPNGAGRAWLTDSSGAGGSLSAGIQPRRLSKPDLVASATPAPWQPASSL